MVIIFPDIEQKLFKANVLVIQSKVLVSHFYKLLFITVTSFNILDLKHNIVMYRMEILEQN